jgi:hypothetical protein
LRAQPLLPNFYNYDNFHKRKSQRKKIDQRIYVNERTTAVNLATIAANTLLEPFDRQAAKINCEAGLADKIEKAGVRQKRKPVSELGEDQERIAKKIKKAFPLDAAVAGAGRSGAAGLDCEVYDSKGLRSQLTDLEVKAGAFLDADSIATRAGQRGTLPGAVFKLQQELPLLKATKTVCDSSLKSDEFHSKTCRWLKQQRQGLLPKDQAKDIVELLDGFLDSQITLAIPRTTITRRRLFSEKPLLTLHCRPRRSQK